MRRATQADWERFHDEISFGNAHARAFTGMWSSFCHLIDDVVDGEKIDAAGFVTELMRAIEAFSFNPFYLQYKRELYPLIVQSASAFLDSYRWEHSPETLQATHANALRVFYDCVNYHVAYICSGNDFNKMREVTERWRDFVWSDVNTDGMANLSEGWRVR